MTVVAKTVVTQDVSRVASQRHRAEELGTHFTPQWREGRRLQASPRESPAKASALAGVEREV